MGIIQGLTEFLPVSSTAHLVLVRWFSGWENGLINSLAFDVALHAGTLLSLIICLRKDIAGILKNDRRLLLFITAGTLPAAAAGVFWGDVIEGALRSPAIIAAALVVFGFLMIVAEGFQKTRGMDSLRLGDVMIIGLAQAVALVPGVSRSGITISAALMLGLKREASARFAFLLSIPVIGGATLYEAGKLASDPGGYEAGIFLTGLAASALSGIAAIKFLLSYLRNHPLHSFAYYRFVLAFIIAGWLWSNGWVWSNA